MTPEEQCNILPKHVQEFLNNWHASKDVIESIMQAFNKSKEYDKLQEEKMINKMIESINGEVLMNKRTLKRKLNSLSEQWAIEYITWSSNDDIGYIMIRIWNNSLRVWFIENPDSTGYHIVDRCSFDFSSDNIDANTKMDLLKNFKDLLKNKIL